MADLDDLADFMDDYLTRNVPAKIANILAVRAAQAIIEDLSVNTPADVGTAVSNWQVSLDTPIDTIVTAFVPSPAGKTVKGVWIHVVPPTLTLLANAPEVIAAAQFVLAAKQPGQVIYITNNLEYINLLDQGSSEQQPAGFVDRARIVGEQEIARAFTTLGIIP